MEFQSDVGGDEGWMNFRWITQKLRVNVVLGFIWYWMQQDCGILWTRNQLN